MKDSDCWQTPDWLMKHFKGHYDPCPPKEVRNVLYNGLVADWESPAYVNPPYSNPLPWVQKAIAESKKGVDVVLLLRVDVSTKWYRLLMEQNPHVAFFNERVKFKGSKGCPNFCSMLVFLEGVLCECERKKEE